MSFTITWNNHPKDPKLHRYVLTRDSDGQVFFRGTDLYILARKQMNISLLALVPRAQLADVPLLISEVPNIQTEIQSTLNNIIGAP